MDIPNLNNLTNLISSDQLFEMIDRSTAIAVLSVDGFFIDSNKNFMKIFDMQSDDLIGNHHSVLVKEKDIESKDYKIFWHKLSQGDFVRGEFERVSKDGSMRWISGSYNPITEGGIVKCIVKFAIDVTQEKRVYKSYENQLVAINRSNSVAEFSVDGKIIFANQNFLDIFGYSAVQIIGKHHSHLLDMNDVDSLSYKDFWKSLNKGEFLRGEFKRKSRDGDDVWIRGSYNPIIDDHGKIIKIIKFALDVTEQKKLEDIIARERMLLENQSKLAALGQMAAGVAHEVNNPLAVMRLKIEDLIVSVNPIGNEFNSQLFIEELQKLYQVTNRIAQTVQSLKKYSKSDSSDPIQTIFNLKDVIKNIIDFSYTTFAKHKVEVRYELEDQNIKGDETSISQVFMNLINNSVYAVKDCEIRDVLIKGYTDNDWHWIEVYDSGSGVPSELKTKIFDPFFTTKGPEGTGLGLSLSLQIMTEHRGNIFYKIEGDLKCFVIKFPKFTRETYE